MINWIENWTITGRHRKKNKNDNTKQNGERDQGDEDADKQ